MKAETKIDNNIIFLVIKTIIACFFSLIAFVPSACQNVKVTIVTVDSLTGENLNDHLVYIDDKEFHYSNKGTNISEFTLDFAKKQSHDIRIIVPSHVQSEFKLVVPPDCTDTSIIVKLLYRFHPRQLPVFFFNKNDLYPDTSNLEYEMEAAYYLSKRHKKDKLIIQLNAYLYPDENDTSNTLIMKRINYIKFLLVDLGADSNMIEIRSIEYKPYMILYKEEINEYFKFKDVLDQEYINNLPPDIRPMAEKYNRRISVTVRSIDN